MEATTYHHSAPAPSNGVISYHRDGTVTFWDVYRQTWTRQVAEHITSQDFATMTAAQRKRIDRMCDR